ncbi:MAG TPA: DUF362 domain-containing protein [Dehalococcoidia bacterium]|nr:DUF362 domain-containing protein [Dehalococcoidia bacterium]
MIFKTADFVFTPPPRLSWARRILIKPCAGYPLPYPVTTSPEILNIIIEGIRKVSDADIIIADGTPSGESIYSIYQGLGYSFHHVLMFDVRDSIFLEIENPLTEFFATPTLWVPNAVLRSDFLISVTPFKVCGNRGHFSIANLLGLLPVSKYRIGEEGRGALYELGIERVLADLYYTLPFDLGIIEARQKFFYTDDPTKGRMEECGKIFIGEPYEIDREASQLAGVECEYLNLIDEARSQLGDLSMDI